MLAPRAEVLGPCAQQLGSFLDELSAVVARAHVVRLFVRQASLDDVGARGRGLVGPCREGRTAQAMHRGPLARIHAAQHSQQRHVRQWLAAGIRCGEDERPIEPLHALDELYRGGCQVHDVRLLGFHPLCWHDPHLRIQIELAPLGEQDIRGARRAEKGELEGPRRDALHVA